MSDPYATLGVNRNSSDSEIKSAYRRLAKKHHPDIGGDQQRFSEISSAYDNIKDAQARQNFDNPPSNFQQSQSPFSENMGGFDDIFNSMFGQGFRQTVRPNTTVTFHVDIKDVYNCATKNLNISMPNGASKPVTITIPKGIQDGSQVRYQGMAPNGGDLIVNYIFKNHHSYTVIESDVHVKLGVSLRDALVGSEKIITTLDNKQIKLHIKSGTQPGTKLRIPENGMPRRNLPNGDMIVEIKVLLPSLKVSDLDKLVKDVL
jgi:curved DNA-binding protein